MLGVMHLAGSAFDALEKNTKRLGEKFEADETDRQTLRIAALLHDVGHPPFSHSLENLLSDEHEDYGNVLIDNYFAATLDDAKIDRDNVKNLIVGDPYPDKPYLSRIINGQLDVDRLDYLLRDSYYTGVWYGEFDLDRIIEQLCVVDKKFVVMQGGYESVEQMIVARHHMYQGVYFHKTKRSFELMLWQCAEILKEKNLLNYPTKDELKEKNRQDQYATLDDNWFLAKIYDDNNPSDVKTIAKMIRERKPYLETYSPLTNRKKTEHVKSQPDDSVEGLQPIETHLLKKLSELGIEKYEFLTDDISRAPYKLMPDYSITDEADPEGDTIQIFYKNNHLVEPIEKRSKLVYQLGGNRPFMIRGFVIPTKYDTIRQFLFDNYDYRLPERNG